LIDDEIVTFCDLQTFCSLLMCSGTT